MKFALNLDILEKVSIYFDNATLLQFGIACTLFNSATQRTLKWRRNVQGKVENGMIYYDDLYEKLIHFNYWCYQLAVDCELRSQSIPKNKILVLAYDWDIPATQREMLRYGLDSYRKPVIGVFFLTKRSLSEQSISAAALLGHVQLVKELLMDPLVNPGDADNEAIRFASENGHLQVVQLLLNDPRVVLNEKEKENLVRQATDCGDHQIVELLLNQ